MRLCLKLLPPASKSGPSRGVTLIELLLALAIMSLAAVAGTQFLREGWSRYRSQHEETITTTKQELIMAVLSHDIRGASHDFVGQEQQLSFRKGSKQKKEIKIEDVTFQYFDGRQWKKTWGWDAAREKPYQGIKGLPLAVSVNGEMIPIMISLLNGRQP